MPPPKPIHVQIAERLQKRAEQRQVAAGVAVDPAEAMLALLKANAKKAAQDRIEIARLEAKTLNDIARANRKEREKIERDGLKAVADYQREQKRKEEEDQKKRDSIPRFSGLSKITEVVGAAVNGIVNFGNALTQFVGKANPVAVQRFTLAVNDMQAVIGQILAPVLERVTLLVRSLGDAFISLSPTAKSLVSGLAAGGGLAAVIGGIVAAVGGLVATFGAIPVIIGAVVSAFAGIAFTMSSGKEIIGSFTKILKVLGKALEIIAAIVLPIINEQLKVLAELFDLLGEALTALGDVINDLLQEIGLADAAKYDPKSKSSVGAAVRQASFTDISGFANKAYASAYGGSQTDIPAKSLDELKGIRVGIDKIADKKEKSTLSTVTSAAKEFGYANLLFPGLGPIAAMRKLFT